MGYVLVRNALDTFQLQEQDVFYQDVCMVLAYVVPFVGHAEWGFRNSVDAPEMEFVEQSAVVDLLQKSRA